MRVVTVPSGRTSLAMIFCIPAVGKPHPIIVLPFGRRCAFPIATL